MSTSSNESPDLVLQREKKLRAIAGLGFELYPRKFDFSHAIPQILGDYSAQSADDLAANKVAVRVAGRVMTIRPQKSSSIKV